LLLQFKPLQATPVMHTRSICRLLETRCRGTNPHHTLTDLATTHAVLGERQGMPHVALMQHTTRRTWNHRSDIRPHQDTAAVRDCILRTIVELARTAAAGCGGTSLHFPRRCSVEGNKKWVERDEREAKRVKNAVAPQHTSPQTRSAAAVHAALNPLRGLMRRARPCSCSASVAVSEPGAIGAHRLSENSSVKRSHEAATPPETAAVMYRRLATLSLALSVFLAACG
jgi:hypothetical protein